MKEEQKEFKKNNLPDEQQYQSYNRIPDDFLKDTFIVPNLFINPENEDHGNFVNQQMRYDLFNDTFGKISDIELSLLKNDDDYVKINRIQECKTQTITGKLLSLYYTKKEDQMIRCENWTLDLNKNQQVTYEIKYYQTPNDRFFSVLTPPDFYKTFLFFRQNKGFL